MITFEQAKQIAQEHIGSDCALLEDSIITKSYGWYFAFQSKKYLASQDFSDALVGSGGFIVEKEDGNIFEFGSAFSLARNLRTYEKGFKYQFYDLTISYVSDLEQSVRLLKKLNMRYVVPEVEYGVEWHIPRLYTERQIGAMLDKLPCIFENQGLYFVVEVFDEIDAIRCCEHELREHCAKKECHT